MQHQLHFKHQNKIVSQSVIIPLPW